MFPGMPVQANKQERKLVKAFKALNGSNKESLIAFAEFLVSRSQGEIQNADSEDEIATEPLDIPRPEEESVVKAIKRLTANYPMIDKEKILHPISGLMGEHIMQGKKAPEVIDKLESLFENEFKKHNSSEAIDDK